MSNIKRKADSYMKWKKADVAQYLEAKEYIDTILIPLIPYQMTGDTELEKNAFQNELTSVLANELEKELTGRIMLTPTYNYVKAADREEEVNRIHSWIEEIQQQPFPHIFLLTLDSSWKKHEQALDGTLLWLPGMKSGDLHSAEMHRFIRDQVEQVSELIRSYW
ncbi:YpiF family protein [Virgibacillus salexigens]|nr:YpiF family protein [Virgibacillus kapii]